MKVIQVTGNGPEALPTSPDTIPKGSNESAAGSAAGSAAEIPREKAASMQLEPTAEHAVDPETHNNDKPARIQFADLLVTGPP